MTVSTVSWRFPPSRATASPALTPAARRPLTSRLTRSLRSVGVNSVNSSMMAGPSGSAAAKSRRCSATMASPSDRPLLYCSTANGRLPARRAKLTLMTENGRHWFEAVADHLGGAYLRYSFTKGTEQEVSFLVECLGLPPGARILDVGCGPGRHAHALGRLGFDVVGVDISERFVA